MVHKPVVFISSTSDLRSARDLVGKVLYSMGYEPVWQEIEATDGGELLDVLRKRVAPCSLVVQLVGDRYGAEPPLPTPEFGRVSYTQFEAIYAEQRGIKVIYQFMDEAFPCDACLPESDDRRALQVAYRQQIKDTNKLRQSGIISSQDLELSIRRISDELSSLRKQSDRRFQKLVRSVGGIVAGLALLTLLVFSGFYLLHTRENEQSVKLDQATTRSTDQFEQLARIEKLLLAQKQANPDAAPQLSAADWTILNDAKKQGDLETRAAASVLSPDATTDKLLEELNAQEADKSLQLAMLNGKRWYFDQRSLYDKAIPFFEKAIALKPDSIEARTYAANSHNAAKLGDISEHQKRAIEICESTLTLVAVGSHDWATTEVNLGNAWQSLPYGHREENVRKAFACYEAALTVFTKDAAPGGWASTQNNIGNAWKNLPTGDRGENVRKAITCYEAALTVRTKDAAPADWAMTQNNLGNAWIEEPTGDRNENLRKAIACYEAALTVYTKDAAPANWASTQNNIGGAWKNLPTGDRGENVRKAITCYEAALTVRTKDAAPADWALTQNNLGRAWSDFTTGDRGGNLRTATTCYEAALSVFTKDTAPIEWAKTQVGLGVAWGNLPTGDRGANLRKEIACYEAALTVYTKETAPVDWAATQNSLGLAWGGLPTGDGEENLRKAISCFEAALTVYTKETAPVEWAATQEGLGIAWGNLPTGNREENIRRAIAYHEAALSVYTRDAAPGKWAMTQGNLGDAWADLPTSDRGDNIRKAIVCYEAALRVQTRDAAPTDWAKTQYKLGVAWGDLPTGDRGENLRKAIACYEAALTVHTKAATPADWARTQASLGTAWSDLPTGDRRENLRKAIAGYDSALTVFDLGDHPQEAVDIRTELSWQRLRIKDFAGALTTVDGVGDGLPSILLLETNHAHALLFLDRVDEARAIYLKHVGEKVDDKTWQQIILKDFDVLEKEGLTHPQMNALREQLQAAGK